MSLNGDVIRVTAATGEAIVVPMYLVYHIKLHPTELSPTMLSKRITEIKYAIDQTGSGDVLVANIPKYVPGQNLYEMGHFGHDGVFCTHLDNK